METYEKWWGTDGKKKGKILGHDETDGELMEKHLKNDENLFGNDEKCWYYVAILPCKCTKMTAFPMAPAAPSLGPSIPSWPEQAGTLMALDGPADTELRKHNSERHRGTGHLPWKTRATKHCQVFSAEKLWLPQFVAPTASTCSGRKMETTETTSLLSSQLPPFTRQRKIWKKNIYIYIYFFRQIPPNQPGFLIHVG